MTVAQLIKALSDLGPEYANSMVITNQAGFSAPAEATRIITIPLFEGVDDRYSFEVFEKVVWIDEGGPNVSLQAEKEGWKVPYVNLVLTSPIQEKGGAP